MEEKKDLLDKLINDYVEKLLKERRQMNEKGEAHIPVITVSNEPGSNGKKIAEELARRMKFEFYNHEIIQKIAKRAHIDSAIIASTEKEYYSGIQDFVSSLINKDYLYPGLYLEYLKDVAKAISTKGHAVFIGRGINFILPSSRRFGVQTVAPLEKRIENVMKDYNCTWEEAEERIKKSEDRRNGFVKKSFKADVGDPVHYDVTINTNILSIETAVEVIEFLFFKKFPAE